MKNLVLFSKTDLNILLNKRDKETKFGEHVTICQHNNIYNSKIFENNAQYVIVGICESIGIQANLGFSSAHKTFKNTIKALLNTQSNHFIDAKNIQILGHLNYPEFQEAIKSLDVKVIKDLKKIRKWVEIIDQDVAQIIHDIVKAGKTPLIIGGGHNNAYGNIKGSSLALNQPINVINFDAHTDFRALEGRHSGNGFSYAMDEGFLKEYFIFGLHENYTSKAVFETMSSFKNINFNTYEALSVRKEQSFKNAIKIAKNHVINKPFGLELDCDAIENISSSAKTPSGFSIEKTRQFIHSFAQEEQVAYFHICEASSGKKNALQIGKLISFLITDFIKANTNK